MVVFKVSVCGWLYWLISFALALVNSQCIILCEEWQQVLVFGRNVLIAMIIDFFFGFADVKKYNFLLCSLFLHMILIAEQSSPFWDTEANDRCMLLCYRLWTGLRMLCMTCTWPPACRNQCGLAWCHLAATVMHFVISLFTSSWHWPPSMTTNLTNCKWLDLLYR